VSLTARLHSPLLPLAFAIGNWSRPVGLRLTSGQDERSAPQLAGSPAAAAGGGAEGWAPPRPHGPSPRPAYCHRRAHACPTPSPPRTTCARACPASGPTSSRDEPDSIAFTLSTRHVVLRPPAWAWPVAASSSRFDPLARPALRGPVHRSPCAPP